MKVVDTNVIAYLLIKGQYTPKAEALYIEDPEWRAPHLWHSEFLNVLAVYLHKNLMSVDEAIALSAQAEALMHAREHSVRASGVLQLVAESHCSAYDCQFIALARDLDTRLVTSDRQLLRSFPDDTISLDSYSP